MLYGSDNKKAIFYFGLCFYFLFFSSFAKEKKINVKEKSLNKYKKLIISKWFGTK
jgi:hypothetical protein